jgi:hypothetical protein
MSAKADTGSAKAIIKPYWLNLMDDAQFAQENRKNLEI